MPIESNGQLYWNCSISNRFGSMRPRGYENSWGRTSFLLASFLHPVAWRCGTKILRSEIKTCHKLETMYIWAILVLSHSLRHGGYKFGKSFARRCLFLHFLPRPPPVCGIKRHHMCTRAIIVLTVIAVIVARKCRVSWGEKSIFVLMTFDVARYAKQRSFNPNRAV